MLDKNLQACDANPDSQAGGDDADHSFPGVALTIKAAQLACQPQRQVGQPASSPGGVPCTTSHQLVPNA